MTAEIKKRVYEVLEEYQTVEVKNRERYIFEYDTEGQYWIFVAPNAIRMTESMMEFAFGKLKELNEKTEAEEWKKLEKG